MKLLKKSWLVSSSYSILYFGYGLVQSMALSALDLGASIFGVLPTLCRPCQGPMFDGVYIWYQTEKVSIQNNSF